MNGFVRDWQGCDGDAVVDILYQIRMHAQKSLEPKKKEAWEALVALIEWANEADAYPDPE